MPALSHLLDLPCCHRPEGPGPGVQSPPEARNAFGNSLEPSGPLGCHQDGSCCCRLSVPGGAGGASRDCMTSPVSCLPSQDGWQER